MYVTTFYSFKGGVGRTMALVNAAVALALNGRRVLVVDFDIEAPGLDTFGALKPREEVPGIIEFVTQYLEQGKSPDASSFVGECVSIGEQGGRLWIMPSGSNEAYAAKLSHIDWWNLYEKQEGYLLFEDLKAQWKQNFNPDYVLIDSRTGHADTCGICTRQLPDSVIIFFFPNDQNLRGLNDIVCDIRSESESPRNKNIEIHFVMSNVPDLDDEDKILESKIKEFQNRLKFKQYPMVVHRYDSLSLLNQVIFTKDRPKSRLANEYRNIVREIAVHNWNDRDGALEYIRRVGRPFKSIDDDSILRQEDMLEQIERTHLADGEVMFRLGELRESHRDLDSAWYLLNMAIDAGYDKPEAYLRRSRVLEYFDSLNEASEDAWRVLLSNQISSHMVREAANRLIRLGRFKCKLFVNSPAVKTLDHNGLLWLAKTFDYSKDAVSIAIALLEQALNIQKLSNSQIIELKLTQGKSYMGLGRCSEAAEMFRSETDDLAEMNIRDAFNYGMAIWGSRGVVETEIFHRVGELANLNQPNYKGPNYLQCMAITNWAIGDTNAARECVKLAVSTFRGLSEFSCWRYLKVSRESFVEDVDEIRSLIEGCGSVMPKFISNISGSNSG